MEYSSLITVRNAVRVFPEPVGEEIRTLFRSWISGTAYAWGSVRVGNFEANQSRTRGCRRESTSSREDCLVTLRNTSRPREKSRSIAAWPKRALGEGGCMREMPLNLRIQSGDK